MLRGTIFPKLVEVHRIQGEIKGHFSKFSGCLLKQSDVSDVLMTDRVGLKRQPLKSKYIDFKTSKSLARKIFFQNELKQSTP